MSYLFKTINSKTKKQNYESVLHDCRKTDKQSVTTLAKTIREARFLPISSGKELRYKTTREPELGARTSAFHPTSPAGGQASASSCSLRLGSCEAVYNSLSQWAH